MFPPVPTRFPYEWEHGKPLNKTILIVFPPFLLKREKSDRDTYKGGVELYIVLEYI